MLPYVLTTLVPIIALRLMSPAQVNSSSVVQGLKITISSHACRHKARLHLYQGQGILGKIQSTVNVVRQSENRNSLSLGSVH
jgi:hypothetical protein